MIFVIKETITNGKLYKEITDIHPFELDFYQKCKKENEQFYLLGTINERWREKHDKVQAQLAVANEENRLLLLERDQLKDNYEKTKVMLSNAEQRLRKQSAELWVAKDSQLRTYDGLAEKADKFDDLVRAFRLALGEEL